MPQPNPDHHQLLIKYVPSKTVRNLKIRAARHGRSLQQELLEIIMAVDSKAWIELECLIKAVSERSAALTNPNKPLYKIPPKD
jgi:plasmid stability protein